MSYVWLERAGVKKTAIMSAHLIGLVKPTSYNTITGIIPGFLLNLCKWFMIVLSLLRTLVSSLFIVLVPFLGIALVLPRVLEVNLK